MLDDDTRYCGAAIMIRLLILALIFTPALPLAVGGWTVIKENRAAKRRKRSA